MHLFFFVFRCNGVSKNNNVLVISFFRRYSTEREDWWCCCCKRSFTVVYPDEMICVIHYRLSWWKSPRGTYKYLLPALNNSTLFFFFLHNETFTPTCCTCFQNSRGDHAHIPQFLRIKNTFYTGQSALKYNVKFLFYSFSKTLGNFWYLPKKGGESAVAVCTTD